MSSGDFTRNCPHGMASERTCGACTPDWKTADLRRRLSDTESWLAAAEAELAHERCLVAQAKRDPEVAKAFNADWQALAMEGEREARTQLDEAVGLLREWSRYWQCQGPGKGVATNTEAFLARVAPTKGGERE